ncbi:MAG: Site-specific recombinase XerD [Armatimonadetes bacterium]|jgi:integrase/recombinase XerC|nr:Site-specific recombinase XerD [Armatimonadota bacterium]
MSELVRTERARVNGRELLTLLLADKRSEATRRAYAADLRDFFGQDLSPREVEQFVTQAPAEIARVLTTYKAELLQRGLTEATINRRLAAIRSLLKFCYRLGWSQTDGRSLVEGERVTAYRDTRGVSAEMVKKLFAVADTRDLTGLRDLALLRLLCENALRRAEVCSLDVADFQPLEKRLYILGKGKGTQKEPETLSDRAVEALQRYLNAAGHGADPKAPLLRNVDPRPEYNGLRLTGDGIYHIVRDLGARVGVPTLTPHKLRHTAITIALDLTDGNVRAVRDLSRHARLETLQRYDDNRRNFQGSVSEKLSNLFDE